MPYCTNCGEEVTEEQRYCGYCGERIGDGSRKSRGSGHRSRGSRGGKPGGGGADRPGAAERTSQRGRDSGRQPPGGSADSQKSTRQPEQTSGYSSETGGFEGDPPPKGYEDPPSVRQSHPVDGIQRKGTIELFSTSLRQIFGLPVVFLGLFLAWFIASSLIIIPAEFGLVGLLFSGILGLVVAGMAYVYAERELRGESATAGEAASQVFSQFLSLLAIWLLFIPVFVLGLFLFILPGLYIGGRLLLAFPACVLDRQGALDSLSTSWELTSRVSLTSMGILALATLTFFGLALVLAIPQNIIFSALGVELAAFETLEEALEVMDDPQLAAVNAFFQAIALAIPTGLVQIAGARLYLQERYGASEQ